MVGIWDAITVKAKGSVHIFFRTAARALPRELIANGNALFVV